MGVAACSASPVATGSELSETEGETEVPARKNLLKEKQVHHTVFSKHRGITSETQRNQPIFNYQHTKRWVVLSFSMVKAAFDLQKA